MAARVVINKKAVGEILRSPAVLADLEARARRIAAAAGPGHKVDSEVGTKRARAAVITETTEARRAEAKARTLTRAIDAGRG